ncbi:HEAT repeat domain-containing protein [Adhaeribacter rhizoryzae]|uniref:HEAT repeat domain-containing protein n=1 Tax=Adhaeribacter rhizoryzae TaxID=2607907 RepID=A0A5M6DLE9_9BACT|nr:HEAT repeat domain-containing protein [Adhaeribacter rhizoryzae]KAA5548273.1 HEAT repeat domain-containing protein [Adhaeribacter rhizoryzae]
MDEKFEKLIAGFLAQNQTEAEKAEMEAAITAGELNLDKVNELTQFTNRLTAVTLPEPSECLRSNFYQMLAEEKRKEKAGVKMPQWLTNLTDRLRQEFTLGQLAYSFVILALGVMLGLQFSRKQSAGDEKLVALTTEMQQMKKMMMLTLLEQPSATDRLKAVNLTSDMEQADDKVIKSLLQTLNADPSVNVRLAAIEALYQHAGNPVAREGLVSAITKQDSPLVQLALADVVVAMQDKNAVKQLKQLLEQEDLNESVKAKVKESIQVLI